MASTFKKYTNFDNLKIGDYRLLTLTLVDTKFGEKVRCDIGDQVVFISKRYIEELEPGKDIHLKLIELNDGDHWLLYRGKDINQGNRLLLNIISSKEYTYGMLDLETVFGIN